MWLHEHPDWPRFTWDAAALSAKLAQVRHAQGRLLGRMEGLGFEARQDAKLHTLTADAVKSSAIEGENLERAVVRSSIARRLGMDIAGLAPASHAVESLVEMMLDATQGYSERLTAERLQAWHSALFPTGRSGMRPITVGGWRSPAAGAMQVVSGPLGRETVHFEAPDAGRLEREMAAFLAWFDDGADLDPVIKAGIAHLWFVTIHPFEDGNGRIARTIGDMALARADAMADRYYSLSSQLEAERDDYYRQLERQQRHAPEITVWLDWFLGCLERAIAAADSGLENVLFKALFWERINQTPVNERQRLVINRMLGDGFQGFMNTSKYAKLAKCSNDTALRDIRILKDQGILVPNPGRGRSTSYRLTAGA